MSSKSQGSFSVLSTLGSQKSSLGSQKSSFASQASQASQKSSLGSQKTQQSQYTQPRSHPRSQLRSQPDSQIYYRTVTTKQDREYIKNLPKYKEYKKALEKRKKVPLGAKIQLPKPCIIYILPKGRYLYSEFFVGDNRNDFSLYRRYPSGTKWRLLKSLVIMNKKCPNVYGLKGDNLKCVDGYVDSVERDMVYLHDPVVHGTEEERGIAKEKEFFGDEPSDKTFFIEELCEENCFAVTFSQGEIHVH